MALPSQGEVWRVDFGGTRGREQAGARPALILSVNRLNHGPAGLVILAPLTTRDRAQPLHVRIDPPEGGVKRPSFVKSEDVRSISTERLIDRWGTVDPETVLRVVMRIRALIHVS